MITTGRRVFAIVLLSSSLLVGADLKLENLLRPDGNGGHELEIRYSGQLSDLQKAQLENRANWSIFYKRLDDEGEPVAGGHPDGAEVKPAGRSVTLRFPDTIPIDQNHSYSVTWTPPLAIATQLSWPADMKAPEGGFYASAKDKKDADVYINASYLSGVGTKPIYMIDAKLNWFYEIPNSQGGIGITSSFVANSGAEPPVSRSVVDPDSIKGAFTYERVDANLKPDNSSGTTKLTFRNGPLLGIITTANLFGGEFSRKEPVSNWVSSAQWVFVTKRIGRRAFFGLDPVLGLEAGRNLNKPSQLFKQNVDLSGYNAIFRGLAGADALFGVIQKDEGYSIRIEGHYLARMPTTDEPFVTQVQNMSTVELNRRVRHDVTAAIKWFPEKYFGLSAQYRYGALPPLFKLVDHQVTLGIVIQLKQRNKPF